MKIINWILIQTQFIKDVFLRIFTGSSSLNQIQVTPKVYLGGSFGAKGVLKLKKWGITAVVNMRKKQPVHGIKTLHFPTRDRTSPKLNNLIEGVKFIQKEIDNGGKVYIHCRQGIGRGPTMMIAYLISTGYSTQEAVALIKKVRAFINPTKKQKRVLKEFEEIINDIA